MSGSPPKTIRRRPLSFSEALQRDGLTERNVDLWKSVQQGFLTAAANTVREGSPDAAKPKKDAKS